MSIDALPYMVFLVMVEFTVGDTLVLVAAQVRGRLPRGFLKMGAATVLASAVLAVWVGMRLGGLGDVGGYPLDDRFLNPARIALWLLAGLLVPYMLLVWREREPAGKALGAAVSAAALVALGLCAALVRLPAWGYAGVLLSLLAGALSLGAVTLGLLLGHWYLVAPRLPAQPLNELTLALAAVLALQAAIVLANVAIPVKIMPDRQAGPLIQNPALWLRLGVGLAFPIALALLAWRASVVRGMMAATGLLYLALGAVLAGEALARGLQFVTAIPF